MGLSTLPTLMPEYNRAIAYGPQRREACMESWIHDGCGPGGMKLPISGISEPRVPRLCLLGEDMCEEGL